MNRGWRGAPSHAVVAAVLLAAWLAPNSTESAVANGDTRTVTFSNQHTNEEGSFTYMVNGVYDQAALDKLNWFMRDWRLNEPTKMDPRLFDIIWEVYRESGSQQPINVFSAYRSPQTNAMLRRRSRGVAEHSQHMEGKAIDAHFEDVSPQRIRDIAMRMEEGGVGFYPQGLTWVHIDSGTVRYWPRMSRDALTRLFPDGKTVFIPSDGQPMPGYEQAKAEIEQRGGEVQTAGGGGLFAWLFGARGGGADDAEEGGGQETVATAGRSGRGGGGRYVAPAAAVDIAEGGPAAVEKAKAGLPTGTAFAGPAPAAPAATKPEVVAEIEQPKVESDAALGDSAAALFAAPMPPRRPANLEQQVALLAAIPLPPIRPVDLASADGPLPPIRRDGAGAPETTASILPPARPIQIADRSLESGTVTEVKPLRSAVSEVTPLPKAITEGVAAHDAGGALALAEAPPSLADRAVLLQRAAELTAPLPPAAGESVAENSAPMRLEAVPARKAGLTDRLKGLLALPFSMFRPSPRASDGPRDAQP
jgi:uncharacterized protein YcbK (DUF882 family)